MKRKHSVSYVWIFVFLLILLFLVFLSVSIYTYNRITGQAAAESSELNKAYRFQYEMIIDSRNDNYWENVYALAKNHASEHDALLALRKAGWSEAYDKCDYVDMCIAARVDGIILEYNGEQGLTEKINEAVSDGIPVVTIFNDATKSNRITYVGISDYQLGQVYAAQAASLIDENTTDILILSNREPELDKNQVYAGIYKAVKEDKGLARQVRVREQNLISQNQFDVEEAIRNIFQSGSKAPDILICMDEVTTECAYQAMIDFNMVGEVNIIGYHISETILSAVEKGLIPVTLVPDEEQTALYCIEALTDFRNDGYSNAYYAVDIHSLTGENAEEAVREEEL